MSEAGDNRTPNGSSTPGAGGAARRGHSSSRAGARSVNPVRRLEAATIDKGVDKAGAKLKGAQQYDEHGQPITTTRDKVVDTATDAVKDTTKVAAAAATGRTVTAVVTAARSNTGKKVLAGVLALALLAAAIPALLIAAVVGSVSTNPDRSTYNRTVAVQTAAQDLPSGEGEMSWERFNIIGDLSAANPFVLAAIYKTGESFSDGGPMSLDEEHDLVKAALEDDESLLTQEGIDDAEISARWLADHLLTSMQKHLDRPQFDLGHGYKDTAEGQKRDPLDGEVNEQRRQDNLEAWETVVADLPIIDAESRAPEIAKIARDWTVGIKYQPPLSGGMSCIISDGNDGVGLPANATANTGLSTEQLTEALQKASENAGIPPNILIAQITAESNWNPRAVSHAGARGLTQFMPATWAEWGDGKDPYDPLAAIDAQGRYMGWLRNWVETRDLHQGDADKLVRLTLAAYNAGPGNVSHGEVPINGETEVYVQKIMGSTPVSCELPAGIEIGDLGSGEWTHPMPGSLMTSRFGFRPCPVSPSLCAIYPDLLNHRGVDFGSGGRGVFVAPADMKITFTEREHESSLARAYGDWIRGVQVESPNLVFEFHHCAHGSIMVKPGDTVAVGTPLCREGTSGNSSAPHLHFQINPPGTKLDGSYQANLAVNPEPILAAKGIAMPKAPWLR